VTDSVPILLEAISLEPISKDQASVLENLFELYVYDFSEQLGLDLKPSGLFEIPLGDQWWTRDDHFPFFIRAGQAGTLLGFALVRRGSRVTVASDVMDVAEFFVVRGARGRGVGQAAARALFAMFDVPWEIRVRKSNPRAQKFWSRVVGSWQVSPCTPEPFARDGIEWNLLRVPRSRVLRSV